MLQKLFWLVVTLVVVLTAALWLLNREAKIEPVPENETVTETEATSSLSADIRAHIDSKADRIRLDAPTPGSVIDSPLTLRGVARGPWFFEATFPIFLTNWDGLIIAEGYATAESDWMTTEFVPFTATLEFENPYNDGDPDFMRRATLILKNSNASGLPERDDALEIPFMF